MAELGCWVHWHGACFEKPKAPPAKVLERGFLLAAPRAWCRAASSVGFAPLADCGHLAHLCDMFEVADIVLPFPRAGRKYQAARLEAVGGIVRVGHAAIS